MSEEFIAFECFSGGVSTGTTLKMKIDELRELVAASKDTEGLNTTAEVCLIGLIAYFESFCKDTFAAIINIHPDIVYDFSLKRDDVIVNATDILIAGDNVRHKLGFLLAEKYDFGSAKSINNLYNALLKVSPLSRDEVDKFNKLLNDRNLLVHHGGVYTMKSATDIYIRRLIKDKVFYDSLVVSKKDFNMWADFIDGIARKMCQACHDALEAILQRNTAEIERQQEIGLEYLKEYGF